MVDIAAVIPVANPEMFERLAASIKKQTLKPDIIIIDNTKDGLLASDVYSLLIRGPFPVNQSWNIGRKVTRDYKYVSFLNDDVILNEGFFKNTEKILSMAGPALGVLCPATIEHDLELFNNSHGSQSVMFTMRKRQGWAWTITRAAIDLCPMIPEQLVTFCGDDWYWRHTHLNGFCWAMYTGNLIFHQVGASVRERGVRGTLTAEKKMFETLYAESVR